MLPCSNIGRLLPDEALDRIKNILRQVKQVEGTFLSLWHNESLSGQGIWKGWREVFEGMVEEGTRDDETRDKERQKGRGTKNDEQ